MITENLSTLKINKLTQEQYDRVLSSGALDANAFYLTPDEEMYSIEEIDDLLKNKADKDHTHDLSDYETVQNSDSKLEEAKNYTDTEIANLINSAPTTLDTLGEIAAAMEENADVVQALDDAIGSKADANHKHDDLYDTKGAANTALETAKGYADTHINNKDIHVTATEKDAWNKTLDDAKSYTDTKVSNTIANYYTKTEIDDMELITVADIDAICGTTIMMARGVVL